MKETLKLGGVLLLVTSICAGLLGVVNGVATPLIEEGKKEATKVAIQSLLPETEKVTMVEPVEEGQVAEIYVASREGKYIGSVVKVMPNGYAGAIQLMVGVNGDLSIAGIQVLSHAETPGLGANITNESFVAQFVNKVEGLSVTKGAANEQEIQAITGATISTQAVVDGVNEAVAYVAANQKKLEEEGMK